MRDVVWFTFLLASSLMFGLWQESLAAALWWFLVVLLADLTLFAAMSGRGVL